MKKNLQRIFITILLYALLFCDSNATTHTIQTSDFQFTPDSLSILAGDTVTWVWLNGIHTTTSNGIPAGAAPWNELLDSLHTSFTYVMIIPGTYRYISVPDLPGMEGEIIVSYPIGISSPLTTGADFNVISNIAQNEIAVDFSIPVTGPVSIIIYDLMGKRAEILLDENIAAGSHNHVFYLRQRFPGSFYLITMHYGNLNLTKRIMIM